MPSGLLSRFVFALCACSLLALGQTSEAPLTDRERALLERIDALEKRVGALEHPAAAAASTPAPANPASDAAAAPQTKSATGDESSLPGFASGTTFNVLLDGYYEYNFNQPLGRVNLLRANDPTSNSFTVNQAAIVVERTPDPAQGRR